MLCPDRGLANPAGLRIREHRKAVDHTHLRALEKAPNPGIELRDNPFLPLHRLAEIQRRRRGKPYPVNRLLGRVLHGFKRAGSVDDGLRGNAPADQAGAAQPVSLDQRRIEAKLPRPDRCHIATRPAANHQHLRLDGLSHGQHPHP